MSGYVFIGNPTSSGVDWSKPRFPFTRREHAAARRQERELYGDCILVGMHVKLSRRSRFLVGRNLGIGVVIARVQPGRYAVRFSKSRQSANMTASHLKPLDNKHNSDLWEANQVERALGGTTQPIVSLTQDEIEKAVAQLEYYHNRQLHWSKA